MKLFQKASAAVLAVCGVLSAVPGAQSAGLQDLPGQELWQPYLNAAPQDADSFVHDPVGALLSLLPASPLEMIRQMAHCYADVLLFLLLLVLLSFLVGEAADHALLELAAAVGCGTLLWGDLMTLAQQVCERMTGWKDYLLGFLPVYSGVLTAGGEANAGAGGKRSAVDRAVFPCTVHGYSRQSAAAKLSCGQHGVLHQYPERAFRHLPRHRCTAAKRAALGRPPFCGFTGAAACNNGAVGSFGAAARRAVHRQCAGHRTGSERYGRGLLTGMGLLKSSLGLAALMVIGAEFLPLYVQLMLHLAFLTVCSLLCGLAANSRCQALFDCMAEAVKCMAAITALYFELLTVGVGLLMMTGGG